MAMGEMDSFFQNLQMHTSSNGESSLLFIHQYYLVPIIHLVDFIDERLMSHTMIESGLLGISVVFC